MSEDSHVNASRSIVTFTDYDRRESPYEGRALRVNLVSDVLFLDFGRLIEERDIEKFERDDEHSIGVDAEALYQTLGMMLRRDDRESFDRLREGTLHSDDTSLRMIPASVTVPAIRTRA